MTALPIQVNAGSDDCVQSLTLNGDDPETFAPYLNARDLINKATGAQEEKQ